MKKSAVVIIIALIALLARPQIIFAQATPEAVRGSWDGIKAVPPGDELIVNLRNGQTIRGKLSGVSDTILTIDSDKKITDIGRGEILKVHRLISGSAKRSTLIGLGVGAAVGSVSGGVAAASGPGESGEYGWGVLIVGTIGMAVGSLVGYIIGSRKQRVLIYETT